MISLKASFDITLPVALSLFAFSTQLFTSYLESKKVDGLKVPLNWNAILLYILHRVNIYPSYGKTMDTYEDNSAYSRDKCDFELFMDT